MLGIGHVLIADRDRIEKTNLCRTPLYDNDDTGMPKARIAAERIKQKSLNKEMTADYIIGDLTSDVGDSAFEWADIVVNCVDNDAAREYVSAMCFRYDKPVIDVGISGLNSSVRCYHNHHSGGCYRCFKAPYRNYSNSCDLTIRKAAARKKIATVIMPAVYVSQFAMQEVCKMAVGLPFRRSVEYHFNGMANRLTIFEDIEEDCLCPNRFIQVRDKIIDSPLRAADTLEDLLRFIKPLGYDTVLADDYPYKYYISGNVVCRHCGKPLPAHGAISRMSEEDFYCDGCSVGSRVEYLQSDGISRSGMSSESTPELLSLPLSELDIPRAHIIPVSGTSGTAYLRLGGDMETILKNYCYHKEVIS